MNRCDKRSSIIIKNVQDICINASMNTFEQIKYYSDELKMQLESLGYSFDMKDSYFYKYDFNAKHNV